MTVTNTQNKDAVNIKELKKVQPTLAKQLTKKLKKKKAKQNKTKNAKISEIKLPIKVELEDVEVKYIKQDLKETVNSSLISHFSDVFERFSAKNEENIKNEQNEEIRPKIRDNEENSDDDDDYLNTPSSSLSKKQLKQMNRPSIAQLKQACKRPEVVESWDITSNEPFFLVSLKSIRNTVNVPNHWSQKRKYMQGKRGFEKPPFKLPHFIEATKISEIRQSLQEKEAHKTLKQKQREKVRPKSHRMDIDYQVLHDAFFKYATKPPLTTFGDIYYEGKENEVKMRQFVPGKYSERLKNALGMTDNAPPSWLINMQRFGPPPSYPNLKIPGLNCPIPKGCVYGFQAGGWGKPPVDEFDNPIYGDFRVDATDNEPQYDEDVWGELPSDQEEEEEEETSETTEQTEEGTSANIDGVRTPATVVTGVDTPFLGGITSVGGLTSVTSGLETPASVDIRKKTVKPYTILPQKEMSLQPGALFASNIGYKIPPPNMMGGTVTPIGGTITPSGMATPQLGGVITPFTQTTHMQTYAQGGITTPLMNTSGLVTPNLTDTQQGMQTPNINTHEQDTPFAGDSIRSQLKKFEEQASKATKAAGLIDPHDASKKTTMSSQTKKKKKKEFKF